MQEQDQERFISQVVADAEEIELLDTLGGSRRAHDFGTGATEDARIAAARQEADRLVADPGVLARLCPALRSTSEDIGSVAKTVGTALLPLALTPAAVVPLSSLVMGAVAVVVLRAGIATICPKPSGDKPAG